MTVFYAIFGVLFVGGFMVFSIIGVLGFIEVVLGSNKDFISYDGKFYRKVDKIEDSKEGKDSFIHFNGNRVVDVFDYVGRVEDK